MVGIGAVRAHLAPEAVRWADQTGCAPVCLDGPMPKPPTLDIWIVTAVQAITYILRSRLVPRPGQRVHAPPPGAHRKEHENACLESASSTSSPRSGPRTAAPWERPT